MIRASFSFGASPSRGSSCQTGSSFGLAVDRTQTENQRTPPPPRTKKALRQSKADVIANMSAGAIRAPTLVPLVKNPLARERWAGSKVRATIRVAPGQLAASAIPNKSRKTTSPTNPVARPVAMETADHSTTAMPNAHRRWKRSINGPTIT